MKKRKLIFRIIASFLLIQPLIAQTWIATKRVTWTSGASDKPAIALDSSNNIHAVYQDSTPGNYEIFYKKSTNGGMTWITKRLTWMPLSSKAPAIAIDSNDHIHVVWGDIIPGNDEIFYRKSTDGGANWTKKRLTYNSGDSNQAAIAIDSSNNIHLLWVDSTPGNDEIFYKKSTNGGATWPITKRLTWTSEASSDPAIAIDSGNNIHVVWHTFFSVSNEIFYKKSTNGGANWTTKRLTYNSSLSFHPAIAVDSSNNIHVVWQDFTAGIPGVFYKKSTNGGANWTTKRLTSSSGSSGSPAIAVDSNDNIHVTWEEYSFGSPEIFYIKSTNGGATWPITKRLTWTAAVSTLPVIATSSTDEINILWSDNSPGNHEIYYKKGIQ